MRHLSLIASLVLLDATVAHAFAQKRQVHRHTMTRAEFCEMKRNNGEVVSDGVQDADPSGFGSGRQRTYGVQVGHTAVIDANKLFRFPGSRAPQIELMNWPQAELGPVPPVVGGQLVVAPRVPLSTTVSILLKASDPDCPQNGFRTAMIPVLIDASRVGGQIAPSLTAPRILTGASMNGAGASPSSVYAISQTQDGQSVAWIGVPHSGQ